MRIIREGIESISQKKKKVGTPHALLHHPSVAFDHKHFNGIMDQEPAFFKNFDRK